MRSKLLPVATTAALLLALVLGVFVVTLHRQVSDLSNDLARERVARTDQQATATDAMTDVSDQLAELRTAVSDTTTVTGLSSRVDKLEKRVSKVCDAGRVTAYTSNLDGQQTSLGDSANFQYFQNFYSLVTALCGLYYE